MKKALMTALVALAAALPSLAQTNIGVVDFEQVIQKSARGKAFFAELEAFQKSKKDEIDGLAQALREKQKDAQAKAASLSEDKRQELGRELENLNTNLKRAREDAERESQIRIQQGLDRIQKELEPLVRQVALEKDLHLVLSYGAQTGIVFVHEKIDITADVIKKYDETN